MRLLLHPVLTRWLNHQMKHFGVIDRLNIFFGDTRYGMSKSDIFGLLRGAVSVGYLSLEKSAQQYANSGL